MKVLGLVCFFIIFSNSVSFAECVKKQGLIDWILGEYTIECSDSYKVNNNDESEDVWVRAGLVAAAVLVCYAIYDYGKNANKPRPSIKHRIFTAPYPIGYLPSKLAKKPLILEPRLFVNNRMKGIGLTLRF